MPSSDVKTMGSEAFTHVALKHCQVWIFKIAVWTVFNLDMRYLLRHQKQCIKCQIDGCLSDMHCGVTLSAEELRNLGNKLPKGASFESIVVSSDLHIILFSAFAL